MMNLTIQEKKLFRLGVSFLGLQMQLEGLPCGTFDQILVSTKKEEDRKQRVKKEVKSSPLKQFLNINFPHYRAILTD